ncbi:hypothetical protein HK100_004196, partial [Physocladia obscura]
FTPKLLEYHEKMKDKFDLVYVGCDDTEQVCSEYHHSSVPFHGIQFRNIQSLNDQLRKNYYGLEIRGLPTLLLLDIETGVLLSTKGYNAIQSDPEGALFPYAKKNVGDIIIDSKFVVGDRGKVNVDVLLNADHLANLFDSLEFPIRQSWDPKCVCGVTPGFRYECQDCRKKFVLCPECYPKLANQHTSKNETHSFDLVPDPNIRVSKILDKLIQDYIAAGGITNTKFRVAMVSYEQTAHKHAEHAAQVPWPTFAFDANGATNYFLKDVLETVTGQPKVVVLDRQKQQINRDAGIAMLKEFSIPYLPQLIGDSSVTIHANGFSKNNKPYINVYGQENNPEIEDILTRVFKTINPDAGEVKTAGGGSRVVYTEDVCIIVPNDGTIPLVEPEILFFYSSFEDEQARMLKRYYKMKNMSMFGYRLNQDDWEKYPSDVPFSEDALQFALDFKLGKLKVTKEEELRKKKEEEDRQKIVD